MNDQRDFTGGREEIERPNPDGCSLKTRIFVGGLGSSVTPNDLEATFSSLGRVHGVEIIRSNDRNFGYMDFEPFSDKALSKLFSSYNGCMWKGGRLRLEKAKEHYLVRLHQEWAAEAVQSATITAEVDASTTSNTPDKRTQMLSDKSGLKMFFPRLNKNKVLPSKGTGKHKYSFQRIESLPLHQLQGGCKHHSMHCESDEGNQDVLDAGDHTLYDGGICEKELNVMNRVMQRLFGNEDQIQMTTEQSERTQPVHVYKYAKRGPGKARIDMEKFNDSDDTEGSINSEAAAENLDELAMAKNIAQDFVEKGSDNIETISLESDQVVKVYYELVEERERVNGKYVAICPVEQLCPFPYDLVQRELKRYPNAKILWCQEEPMNMGGYPYITPHLLTAMKAISRGTYHDIKYVGRAPSAATTTGFSQVHVHEQREMVQKELQLTPI